MTDSEILNISEKLKSFYEKDLNNISVCLGGEVLERYRKLMELEIEYLQNMKSKIDKIYSERI